MLEALLLVAHPGHELLLHGWIHQARPVVHVLTDGGGHARSPRHDLTTELVRDAGARRGAIFARLSDREAYEMILERNAALLLAVVDELAAAMASQRPDGVVCDAVEGYNPVHDLCRLIAGAAIELSGIGAKQYEYAVVGHPSRLAAEALVVDLDDAAHAAKIDAARRHATRVADVGEMLLRYGAEAFRREVFRPVDDWHELGGSEPRMYERIGEERVAARRYERVIRRDEHLAPLRDALCAALDARTCAS